MENVMFAVPRPSPNRAPGFDRLGRAAWLKHPLALLRAIGPYVAIELILPGGTLIALVCFFVRCKWLRARGQLGSSAISQPYAQPQYLRVIKWLRADDRGAKLAVDLKPLAVAR
jgi:hypothetical protein